MTHSCFMHQCIKPNQHIVFHNQTNTGVDPKFLEKGFICIRGVCVCVGGGGGGGVGFALLI